ncbi:MAG: response regulator [Candidatus Heimdallarchaeota archaeon]|nr:response regulator [Candidatus Heimdallarchaeota archaeon]
MGLKPRILVIDDNEIIRTILHELLTRKGYETYVSSDGLTALEDIRKINPHIAIVDLMLPGITGIDVIKKIRKLSPTTESIIITGYSSYESALQILDSQIASGFLEKPVDVDKLIVTITDLLQRHESQIKIQEDLEEIEKINYQLEFFNTVLFRDFKLQTNALKQSYEMLHKTELTSEQKKGLSIIESLYLNNIQLINSYKKIRKIHGLDSSKFVKIDIIEILLDVINIIVERKLKCDISFAQGKSKEQYFVYGTKDELEDLFFELIYSMIMPSILENITISIIIEKSKQILGQNSEKIPTIGIKLTTLSPLTVPEEKVEIVKEFESQKYGLGFYITKNLIDHFKGKIFLEDSKENDYLKTTLIIYLPAV